MTSRRHISRRHFLAIGAAAAAGCATSKPLPGAAKIVSARIGVIGCGARGTELIAMLTQDAACSRAGISAVCDVYAPRLEQARALTGAPGVRDWRELIARDDVDAVIIAAPDHAHAPMAVAAMEAGKDVYCESPMALTLAEAGEFRACAERTERVVQIGADQASEAYWHVAAEIVRSGAIGPVRWAQAATAPAAEDVDALVETDVTPQNLDWKAFLGNAPARPFEAARFSRWRNYWDYSGGIATSRYYAQIMPLLVALGPDFPDRVSAAGGVYAGDGRETPDSFVMNAEYPGGHTIVLAHSAAGRRARPAVIRGERASLELGDGKVHIVPEPEFGNAAPPVAERTIAAEPRQSHLANWIDCMRTRQKCLCDEELGYRAMVTVAMAVDAYRSAKTLRYDVAANAVVEAPRRGNVA